MSSEIGFNEFSYRAVKSPMDAVPGFLVRAKSALFRHRTH